MAAHIVSQENPKLLTQIIVVDLNWTRLKLAEAFGATHFINPTTEDALIKLMEITERDRLDAGVDCSGVLSVINTMIESIGSGGIAVTIRNLGNDSKASVPILPFIAGAKTYCGSHQGNYHSRSVGIHPLHSSSNMLIFVSSSHVWPVSTSKVGCQSIAFRQPTRLRISMKLFLI
jgi:aryl-alcohol dehydrogenase